MNSNVINAARWQFSTEQSMLMVMSMLAIAWLVQFQCHAFGAMLELYSKARDGVANEILIHNLHPQAVGNAQEHAQT